MDGNGLLLEPTFSAASAAMDGGVRKPDEQRRSPTRTDVPAFLLNVPFSHSTNAPNNVWMEEVDPAQRCVDSKKGMRQFLDLYNFLAGEALVYLLPAPRDCNLQDLVFTANLGIVLGHVSGPDTVVISKYRSAPRVMEAPLGEAFFRSMGYDVHMAPHYFEGEAELKHLSGNTYVGGYGIRTDRAVYDWMERTFEMKVIKVKETNPYLYHLDCAIFPLTTEETLVCTGAFQKSEIAEIEKHTSIIDVNIDDASSGICNCVRLGKTILNASSIHDLRKGTGEYELEREKNRALEDIAADRGLDVAFFNLGEYMKSGALLSCLVMHLNRRSYDLRLT